MLNHTEEIDVLAALFAETQGPVRRNPRKIPGSVFEAHKHNRRQGSISNFMPRNRIFFQGTLNEQLNILFIIFPIKLLGLNY